MKFLVSLLMLLVVFAIPTFSMAQSTVEFFWTQPDSSAGSTMPNGDPCCKMALPDGDLEKYEIFIATPADTTYWGFVLAPNDLSENGTAIVPFDLLVPSSIAVRAVDIRGRTGALSLFSEPITLDPGPPDAPATPATVRVFFGG